METKRKVKTKPNGRIGYLLGFGVDYSVGDNCAGTFTVGIIEYDNNGSIELLPVDNFEFVYERMPRKIPRR